MAATDFQKGRRTKVSGPPAAGSCKRRPPAQSSRFREFYNRGDLPIGVNHAATTNKIIWKAEIESLDYDIYLPIFFHGLVEVTYPYDCLAKQGIHDMIEHGKHKVLSVVPQLIIPIKEALETRDPEVLRKTLKILQRMVVSCEFVGEALVPYFKQILPVLNIFKNKRINTGDKIDYGQYRGENLGDLIRETIEILEKYGGPDAYVNIKYMIPTYESCVHNL